MEFSCDRKSLLAAARRTAKAAASTTTVDALAGILLTADAENYELTLSATDLNIAITCTVTAPVVAGGSVVVGAKLFVEMLSLLKGQTVEIKLHPQHQLAVTSDTAGYLVACLPAEEFPSLNLPEQTETIELSGVKGLAKQTVFAAAKSGNLPMQCVKLELSGDSLRAIGCDGAVLSASRRELTGGKPVSLLIPAPSFSALAGSVGEEEKLLFSTDGKQAVFYRYDLCHPAGVRDILGRRHCPFRCGQTVRGPCRRLRISECPGSDHYPVRHRLRLHQSGVLFGNDLPYLRNGAWDCQRQLTSTGHYCHAPGGLLLSGQKAAARHPDHERPHSAHRIRRRVASYLRRGTVFFPVPRQKTSGKDRQKENDKEISDKSRIGGFHHE